jgi:hypothetical protein
MARIALVGKVVRKIGKAIADADLHGIIEVAINGHEGANAMVA